jgi:hypothetical protein
MAARGELRPTAHTAKSQEAFVLSGEPIYLQGFDPSLVPQHDEERMRIRRSLQCSGQKLVHLLVDEQDVAVAPQIRGRRLLLSSLVLLSCPTFLDGNPSEIQSRLKAATRLSGRRSGILCRVDENRTSGGKPVPVGRRDIGIVKACEGLSRRQRPRPYAAISPRSLRRWLLVLRPSPETGRLRKTCAAFIDRPQRVIVLARRSRAKQLSTFRTLRKRLL